MGKYLRIHNKDNVAIALKEIKKGDKILIDNEEIIVKNDISAGHKIAVRKIKKGQDIIKYGFPIGHALRDIYVGEHVHIHNLGTNLKGINQYSFYQKIEEIKYPKQDLTFKGFRRKHGKIGIRNELWIVPTVGCVNGPAFDIKERFLNEVEVEGIDGVHVFSHPYGCSQLGEDFLNTRRILADIVKHPNAGGVMVFGLGCENNYVSAFKEVLGDYDEDRVKFLVAQ